METDIYKIYELWDLSTPIIKERSTLFHLEPIGVGTPNIESLTSYVKRLAIAHSVSSTMLILGEITPLLDIEYVLGQYNKSLNRIYGRRTHALNGTGKMALGLVNALELKTLCSNLNFLTMLTWRNVFYQRALMRNHQAWCPFCFQEWYENKQIIHEPLYWSFKAINICTKHDKILLENCPHCKQYQVPLSRQAQPGYCSKCRGWLGDIPKNLNIDDMALPIEQREWQSFVVNNIKNLITFAPHLKSTPDTNKIKDNILAIIEKTSQNNLKTFASLSNIPYEFLYYFLRNSQYILMDNLLITSFQLGISLIDLLTKEPMINLDSLCIRRSQKNNMPSVKKPRKEYFKHSNIAQAQRIIDDALQELPPPSISEVATRIGCHWNTIVKNFSESYFLLKKRYDCYQTELLKEKLEATLYEEPPRTVTQISKSLGYKTTNTLYRYFPDIYYQILSRYRNYKAQIRQSKC